MKEPEYNENGCVSGGFIFDQMDRYAHDKIKEIVPDKYVFTRDVAITFCRQICDWNKVKIISLVAEWNNSANTRIVVQVINDEDILNPIYAHAIFNFAVKDKAYCEGIEK